MCFMEINQYCMLQEGRSGDVDEDNLDCIDYDNSDDVPDLMLFRAAATLLH